MHSRDGIGSIPVDSSRVIRCRKKILQCCHSNPSSNILLPSHRRIDRFRSVEVFPVVAFIVQP
ncbi:hypothetical protein PSAB6_370069 [Paraburkholderia sabiae]|nr:hypothetical protein PSAB6_370069 [Paraburkholderia sabiae]